MSVTPVFRVLGDSALSVEFGTVIDEAVNALVIALDRALDADRLAGMIESVPSFASLLVVYDPIVTDPATLEAAIRRIDLNSDAIRTSTTEHVVPVCYDGEAAPDLASAADRLSLAPADLVAHHLAGEYRVYMYGFAPGYAYMGGVPSQLRLPRKPAAERGHAVGSVMIAGGQCLITTLPMPTGWWVIGRTAVRVLDVANDSPFLFQPGDRIRFVKAPIG